MLILACARRASFTPDAPEGVSLRLSSSSAGDPALQTMCDLDKLLHADVSTLVRKMRKHPNPTICSDVHALPPWVYMNALFRCVLAAHQRGCPYRPMRYVALNTRTYSGGSCFTPEDVIRALPPFRTSVRICYTSILRSRFRIRKA